ncbi:MAG: hypothetical protein M1820_006608 [Bogoriella megaspora]|nr:MAG: hypothetical protein M1820_006608 [Bogoriella megaspora]
MVTGIEAAGLALAVLPLVVEAAKSYAKGVDSIKDVVIASRRDEKLQEFYDHFYWETFLLDGTLREIVDGLPLLCRDCKSSLYSDRSLRVWEEDEEVGRALLEYFGNEENLSAFLLILSRVLELIDRLTRGKTTQLNGAEKSSKDIYARLKEFARDRLTHKTKSTFFERFRFFKEEKNRNAAVRNLKTWGKRLMTLSQSRIKQLEQLSVTTPSASFSEIRTLFHTFLRVVGNHWKCDCPKRHKAMICLRIWPHSIRNSKPRKLEFDILLPRTGNQQAQGQWLEGTVSVDSEKTARTTDKVVQSKVCDVLGEQAESALRFLICAADRGNTLWRMRSEPPKLSWLNKRPLITLQDSLSSQTLARLKKKRVLAVTFAYALLQCHSIPCTTDVLRKESIYFSQLTADDTDFGTPFVSTEFESAASSTTIVNMALQHRSPPILRLGILLLEIHKGALFESLLNTSEAADTSPNRDLTAARRLVEHLEEWCSDQYKNAIRACLEIPWVPRGEQVDFSNAEICGGFVEQVVRPLESELEHLFSMKI